MRAPRGQTMQRFALGFAAVLLLECYAASEILGAILDRTDLQDVGVSE